MGLSMLLIFIPIALLLRWLGVNPILVFLASALFIVPLAKIMSEATDTLS